MKTALGNLALEIKCPVIQFDIDSVDWTFNDDLGLCALLKSPLRKEVAFEYIDSVTGQNVIMHLTVEKVDNETNQMVTLTTIDSIAFNKYTARKFFYSVDVEGAVDKIVYEEPETGEMRFIEEEEEEDDEVIDHRENPDDDDVDYDEDDDDEYNPEDAPIHNVNTSRGTCPYDYDELINILFMIDGLLDIAHCGNVTLTKVDDNWDITRIHLLPHDEHYPVSKTFATNRYSFEDGTFNPDSLEKDVLII